MNGPVCSISKPTKDGARNCARQFLQKIMKREYQKDADHQPNQGYSADDIEKIVYNYYPDRDSYLSKIARIGAHLSLHTRVGRISWTFQDAIFNNRSNKYGKQEMDYLEWLMTKSTNQDVFPELYNSGDAISPKDREQYLSYMNLEHAALFNGLQEIVRKCCDSKVCSPEEYNTTYDEMLFKSGTVFSTAARSICITRKIQDWTPPITDISIPDTTPVAERPIIDGNVVDNSDVEGIDYDTLGDVEYQKLLKNRTLERQRSYLNSTAAVTDLKRNYDSSVNMTCLNVDNLIHNFAILAEGRFLELPWDGQLLTAELQEDLLLKFRVEIALRKYYLKELRRVLPSK